MTAALLLPAAAAGDAWLSRFSKAHEGIKFITEDRSLLFNSAEEAYSFGPGGPGGSSAGAAESPNVRIRHYTSNSGLEGIAEDNVIRARDQGSVFAESTNRAPMSARQAEDYYGLKQGRGQNYVETDIKAHRVNRVWNKREKVWELKIKGDVELVNPTFEKR